MNGSVAVVKVSLSSNEVGSFQISVIHMAGEKPPR